MKWRKVYLFLLAALLVGLTVLLSAGAFPARLSVR